MIHVEVKTLIMLAPPAPSALVITPKDERAVTHDCDKIIYPIVPIWVGSAEAISLGMALEGCKSLRPVTHDLFLDALTSLDARIERVVIDSLQGQTFAAKLYMRQYGREVELDARPSDAIALAIRQDAPLFMDEEVFERGSFPYIVRGEQNEEAVIKDFRSFLENIAPEDFLGNQ